MFCVKCGKPLDEGARFCLLCGAAQDTVDFGQGSDLPPDLDNLEIAESDLPLLGESEEDNIEIADDDGFNEKVPEGYAEKTADVFEKADDAPTRKAKVMKPDRSRRKPMSAAPTVLICILFSALTLIFGMGSSVLLGVRDLLMNGFVSTEAEDLNPLNLNASDIITDPAALEKALADSGIAEVEIGEIGENETLGDLIERTFVKYGVTEDEAEQFLEKSALMPYLAEVVSAYENFLLTGEDVKPVTDKKLKETALNCMDYASKELGFKFRPDSEQRLDDFLKKNKDEIRALNPSEALGVGGSYVRYAFSVPVIVGLSVLAVVMAALAGLITRRADAAFVSFGIPAFISGAVFLYVGLFPRVVLANAGILSIAAGTDIEQYAAVFIRLGASELVLGVVFIAVFAACRVIASKIAKRKALQSA